MSSSRRRFLKAAAAVGAASVFSPFEEKLPGQTPPSTGSAAAPPPAREAESSSSSYVLVTSANGVEAAKAARQALIQGYDPLDAAIVGVNVNELDPNDVSVGYGGIPNEEGVVQLDACVMDGRTMKAGAVGALEGVKTPSKVAKLVMERTDRVFLVGEGARKFATSHGFPVEDLLTAKTRKIWLYWKERLSDTDDWIEAGKEAEDPDIKEFIKKYGNEYFRPQGTIHMSVRSAKGDFAGVTTTSGLYFKMPGRVGDSAVVGAGVYSENGVGSCGSTGRGEAVLVACGSYTVVDFMRQGKSPEEACLLALRRIAEKTHNVPRHRDDKGRPKFNVSFYAIDAKGQTAGAAIWSGSKHVVGDNDGVRTVESAYLYKKGT
jgi:N4-(beta-N-acetylglucosaminyl)-L-asparaginase